MDRNYRGANQDREDNSGIFRDRLRQSSLKTQKQSDVSQLTENENEDLSGCLASQGFAVKKTVEQKQPGATDYRDEDLSGCLASGFLKPTNAQKQPVETDYRDEDLSGCLASGFLKPTKIQPKVSHRSRFTPTERDDLSGEIKPNDEEGSGWLYLN
jgi:hypothetical protein